MDRRVELPADEPLFVLTCSDRTWKLWADGRAEGFPQGTVIENRARPLLDALLSQARTLAREEPLPTPSVAGQEAKPRD